VSTLISARIDPSENEFEQYNDCAYLMDLDDPEPDLTVYIGALEYDQVIDGFNTGCRIPDDDDKMDYWYFYYDGNDWDQRMEEDFTWFTNTENKVKIITVDAVEGTYDIKI
jgi:hypothetical protein